VDGRPCSRPCWPRSFPRDTARFFYATRFHGLMRAASWTHVVRVCKHMRVKYFSHCNPPLPTTQCDMFSQFSCVIRSRSHADCIYTYNILFTQPRRRPLHSQLRAHPRYFCSSRLYFSSCSFFFFCIFYSALNISRAKCAIHKCSCRMSTYVYGYFIGQTRSACAIFTIVIVR